MESRVRMNKIAERVKTEQSGAQREYVDSLFFLREKRGGEGRERERENNA